MGKIRLWEMRYYFGNYAVILHLQVFALGYGYLPGREMKRRGAICWWVRDMGKLYHDSTYVCDVNHVI